MAADPEAVSMKHFEKRCKAWGHHHYGKKAEFDFDHEVDGSYTYYLCMVWLNDSLVAHLELGPIGFQILSSKKHRIDEP